MSSRTGRRSVFDLISDYLEKMESLADDLLPVERPSWDVKAGTIQPLCNVSVAPDEVVVTADLPFSDPDSIEIEPSDERTLEITAKFRRRICCEDLGIIHHRGEFSTFNCQTRIPVAVDMKRRTERFKKGVLEVKLPRKKGYEIKLE
ncbi:MAG: Hsp20/alpha crystallin family protein [Candidatus Bathyarchaeota archaeon]|nr:Hsp20/alpha crystallin family protein [Candidatus Bathyarchaeota archaeon]